MIKCILKGLGQVLILSIAILSAFFLMMWPLLVFSPGNMLGVAFIVNLAFLLGVGFGLLDYYTQD